MYFGEISGIEVKFLSAILGVLRFRINKNFTMICS